MCSKHFKLEEYEDQMQARLLNLVPKKPKKDAIPSLLLPSTNAAKNLVTIFKRSNRMLQKEERNIVKELINKEANQIVSSISFEIDMNYNSKTDISKNPSMSKETDYDILKRKFESIEKENLILKQKIVYHENNER